MGDKKSSKANSAKKIQLQISDVVDKSVFQEEVKKIRSMNNIPDEGYLFLPESALILPDDNNNGVVRITQDALYFSLWKKLSNYKPEMEKIEQMLPVMNRYYSLLLRNYVFYNKLFFDELEPYRDPTYDLCRLVSKDEEIEHFTLPDDEETTISIDDHNDRVYSLIGSHPISIRFRPEISQKTLIGFIKDNWAEIEALQKEYADPTTSKYGKTFRNPLIKERDDLVWENRELSRNKIVGLLQKRYGSNSRLCCDEGTINKIISREKKKRDKK